MAGRTCNKLNVDGTRCGRSLPLGSSSCGVTHTRWGAAARLRAGRAARKREEAERLRAAAVAGADPMADVADVEADREMAGALSAQRRTERRRKGRVRARRRGVRAGLRSLGRMAARIFTLSFRATADPLGTADRVLPGGGGGGTFMRSPAGSVDRVVRRRLRSRGRVRLVGERPGDVSRARREESEAARLAAARRRAGKTGP